MRTIKLTIEYEGTNYSGWQTQPNGLAVQEVIEAALLKLLGEKTKLKSSGRTDAGVHASGMVASFQTCRTIPLSAFIDGTNRFLPVDIAIIDAIEVKTDFKAIGDALYKHYRYTILISNVRSPLNRLYSWQIKEKLNIAAMQEAALMLVGHHDFAAFRASNCVAKTTVRRVDSVGVSRKDKFIFIDVVGEGFLKNMVRIIAGTLVDIGRGRFPASHIDWLLENRDRTNAGVTAPACGLCLISVTYADQT